MAFGTLILFSDNTFRSLQWFPAVWTFKFDTHYKYPFKKHGLQFSPLSGISAERASLFMAKKWDAMEMYNPIKLWRDSPIRCRRPLAVFADQAGLKLPAQVTILYGPDGHRWRLFSRQFRVNHPVSCRPASLSCCPRWPARLSRLGSQGNNRHHRSSDTNRLHSRIAE